MDAHEKTQSALNAWLDTVAADTENCATSLTIRPSGLSTQPLLREFGNLDATQSAAPLTIGQTIAKGGMGLIRSAKQPALGRTVVVKALNNGFQKEAAEHVLREAWATGALEHPNIVPVHDIRVDEAGAPLIVLKRIEGRAWSEFIADDEAVKQHFGATDLLEWNLGILRQVVQAVRFAHSRNILHRDLKPDNVMIGSFGEVYVVDWGIALNLGAKEESPLPHASEEEGMAGTPCYMAPEMLGGAPLDARTDVYLVGAILFEILAQAPPHNGETFDELLRTITESNVVLPASACPLLSELCAQAMARSPVERFQDVDELAVAFQECRVHRESRRLASIAGTMKREVLKLTSGEEPERSEIYRLFGAMRQGYIDALKVWPENPEAQQELDEAREALVHFELGLGNSHAAQSILVEFSTANPKLQHRVEQALASSHSERAELALFRGDVDISISSGTRILVMLSLGSLWTVTPLVHFFWPIPLMATYGGMTIMTLTFMVITGGLMYWARESITKNLINRRIAATWLALFPSQILLYAGAAMMGLPAQIGQQLMLLVWSTIAAAAVAFIDWRLLPMAVSYFAAFLIAATWPNLLYPAMAVGNLSLTLSASLLWHLHASGNLEEA